MRLGLSVALQYDLSTSPNLLPAFVSGDSGAYQMGATEVLRTTVDKRAGGRVHVEAAITDLRTQRCRKVIDADAPSEKGLIVALNSIAKQIDPQATDFSTTSAGALQSFTTAAQSAGLQARARDLRAAIQADPGFGLAYLLLLNTVAPTSEQSLAEVLSQADIHRNTFKPLDQARLAELSARLKHEGLRRQEETASAVLKLAPNDVETLAALGVTRFLQGDATGGHRFLGRALQLSPGNESIRQELAHGLIETKRYAEAEKLIVNPTDLAICFLLQGDMARANAAMEKLTASLGNPELKTLFRANWLAISGNVNQAVDIIKHADFSDPTARSAALVQVAFWQAMGHDFTGAKNSAARARKLTTSSGSLALVAQLLTQADKPPAEWRRQIAAAALNTSSEQILLGYGFFLYGHYSDSASVWQQILNQSGDTDLRARAMLASSLDHAGRADEARRIRVQPFVPEFGDIYAPISFNEMRRLIR